MTLQDIINKAKKDDVIQFTTRGNRFRGKKNFTIIQIIGHKVMSKDSKGEIYFNRLDYIPLKYTFNPLTF
ncbi:hypothetical protein [Tenacibaculum sp. 47A_GOM-205m]|uniref:hypothetical protein n=1 Tax=Tenacibaculum sp. 47A_GOM-205m TaxID=1380384 RepID=UPI00048CB4AD|nr:hypothetical protein [Tenacibaculum sp. 47A_GOM-205m]